jgi:nucleoid-associated protein YgaU
MSGDRRRPAATAAVAVLLPAVLALVGACIPPPVGVAHGSPAVSGGSAGTTATSIDPTPAPTAVPSGPSAPPSFVRPTPTPLPTFLSYVVKAGDTLDSIALAHGTTARSIAFWNRSGYPSLDPDSAAYAPDRIKIGWVLLLVPDIEIDEDQTFP